VITANWVNELSPGDIVRSKFELALMIDNTKAKRSVFINPNHSIMVLDIATHAVVDNINLTCFTQGKVCRVVLMRNNFIKAFELVSKFENCE